MEKILNKEEFLNSLNLFLQEINKYNELNISNEIEKFSSDIRKTIKKDSFCLDDKILNKYYYYRKVVELHVKFANTIKPNFY